MTFLRDEQRIKTKEENLQFKPISDGIKNWAGVILVGFEEKLSLGFWVTKIKIAGACFPNSWCNQPPTPHHS